MSKQRPTLDQAPTQSGRTRHQNRGAVTGASYNRDDVGSFCSPYSLPSPLEGDVVAQS